MFVDAVVIRCDCASSHIYIGSQLGIADVAEVINLAAGADLAFLYFHKVADSDVLT